MKKILILLILSSCINNSDNQHKKNTKTFDDRSNQKKETIKIDKDTSYIKEYNKNGVLVSEGKILKDSIKIGEWIVYKNGAVESKVEYVVKNKSHYLNQLRFYDSNNNLKGGYYYEINKLKSEYDLGDNIRVEIFIPHKYFNYLDSEIFLVYSTKEIIEKETSKRDTTNLDTIWNLYRRYPKKFNEEESKLFVLFNIQADKVGDFLLSGVLTEQAKDYNGKDTLTLQREMFLEIDFKVKDTLN